MEVSGTRRDFFFNIIDFHTGPNNPWAGALKDLL